MRIRGYLNYGWEQISRKHSFHARGETRSMKSSKIIVAIAAQAVLGVALDDVRRLNFALGIENAKHALFEAHLGSSQKPDSIFSSRALLRISDHTKLYQASLAEAIKAAGGQPEKPCEYEFNVKNEQDFLEVVRGLETVGVQMNVGLVADLATPKHRLELARMVTTQGRHLAYVNQLAGADPYPEDSEDAVAPEQAMTYLQNYIKVCPHTRSRGFRRLSLHPSSGPPGTLVTFSTPYSQRDQANNSTDDKEERRRVFCTFLYTRRQFFVAVYGQNRCKVPRETPFGLVKVYITNMRRRVSSQFDSHVIAGPSLFDVRSSSGFPSSSPSSSPFPFPFPAPFPELPSLSESEDSNDLESNADDYPQNIADLLPPLQAYPMEPPVLYPQNSSPYRPPSGPYLPPPSNYPPPQQYPPVQSYPPSQPYPPAFPPSYPGSPLQPNYPGFPPALPPNSIFPGIGAFPPNLGSPFPSAFGKQPASPRSSPEAKETADSTPNSEDTTSAPPTPDNTDSALPVPEGTPPKAEEAASAIPGDTTSALPTPDNTASSLPIPEGTPPKAEEAASAIPGDTTSALPTPDNTASSLPIPEGTPPKAEEAASAIPGDTANPHPHPISEADAMAHQPIP